MAVDGDGARFVDGAFDDGFSGSACSHKLVEGVAGFGAGGLVGDACHSIAALVIPPALAAEGGVGGIFEHGIEEFAGWVVAQSEGGVHSAEAAFPGGDAPGGVIVVSESRGGVAADLMVDFGEGEGFGAGGKLRITNCLGD